MRKIVLIIFIMFLALPAVSFAAPKKKPADSKAKFDKTFNLEIKDLHALLPEQSEEQPIQPCCDTESYTSADKTLIDEMPVRPEFRYYSGDDYDLNSRTKNNQEIKLKMDLDF